MPVVIILEETAIETTQIKFYLYDAKILRSNEPALHAIYTNHNVHQLSPFMNTRGYQTSQHTRIKTIK